MAAVGPEFEARHDPGPRRASGWGWGICWFLFAATTLNYMDRQAVSVVAKSITEEFQIRFEDLGWIIAAFQIPFALFQIPAGFLADRWDVRKTYAAAVVWWSLAAMAVAWSPTLGALMAFRAMLGVGEAFNWPCALRVTAMVLPREDRGLGNGIFNSGAAVGAVLTPLIVVPLTYYFGWRVAFALIGAAGFIWAAAWLVATSGPARGLFLEAPKPVDPTATGRDRATTWAFVALAAIAIAGGIAGLRPLGLSAIWLAVAFLMLGLLGLARAIPPGRLGTAGWAAGLGAVVRLRRFWILVVVSISINVCWHFLVNWLPTYLGTDRGMKFVTGSLLSAVPFLAADAGNIGGGWAVRWLARRGMETSRARLRVLGICVILISSGVGVGWVRSNTLTIILLAVMALGTAAFMANYLACTQEVAAGRTGLVVGILGGIGNLFAAGFAPIAGRIKDVTGSLGPVFLIVGLLPFIGLAALAIGWGRDEDEARPVA